MHQHFNDFFNYQLSNFRIPEAKHKYNADKDDFISDEDLIAEYEHEDIKNILGEEL